MTRRSSRRFAALALAIAFGASSAIVPSIASAGIADRMPALRPIAGWSGVMVPAAAAAATQAAVPTITVTAVGDMSFASSVGRLISDKGPKAPFTSARALLMKADVTVGNLECALSRRGRPVSGKTFTFRGSPAAVAGLTWAGFDLLALGNNHARDYGGVALGDTIKTLDKAHIAHAGAGANRKKAFGAAYIERGGATIAFLSFSQIGPASFVAGSSRSGTAYTMSTTTVQKAIKAARKKADYVIVSYHWGIERHYSPTARQVSCGRMAIRSGADLVLSHHPHVIQGVEFYRSGLIAYSLGNFVFSPGSANGHESMVLSLTLGPKGVRNVVARAVKIDSRGRPVLVKGSARTRILGIVRRTSSARKTHVTVAAGVARLHK